MTWELTKKSDWLDKGCCTEKVYSGIRLSDEDVRRMNRFSYEDWMMNECEPEKYTQEQRARAATRNSDFWDDIVERYGIDQGRPFSINNDGVVHFWRVAD